MKWIRKETAKVGNLNPLSYDSPGALTSYTGADITAVAYIHDQLKVLGELQTISYSIHREKTAVMLLGRVNPPCFTRSARTIAGSLIFTVFDQDVMAELVDTYPDDTIDNDFSPILADQIPPFDITIQFINEDGFLSSMVIYGIEIVDDGQVMSINDMIIENVKSYKARGIDLMYKKDPGVWTPARKLSSSARFDSLIPGSANDVNYIKYIDSLTQQIVQKQVEIAQYLAINAQITNVNEIDANTMSINKLQYEIEQLRKELKEVQIKYGLLVQHPSTMYDTVMP